MSILSSLTLRSRFLTALSKGRRRRTATEAAASESLEDRALLSAVSFSSATSSAVFNADANDENVLRISSPNSDTLVVRAQKLSGGLLVDDVITLQGDAAGNAGFSLDATGSELTINVTGAGSLVDSFLVNVFEEADQVLALSTPAATFIEINGGTGADRFDVGSLFTMDDIQGDLSFVGGPGADTLNLDDLDSNVSDTITLTDSSVRGISPGDIDYATIETLSLDAADQVPLTLNVLSTAAGVETIADLTFEDDSLAPVQSLVTIGNTAENFGRSDSPGNTDNIAGNITLVNSGTLALQIDDAGDTSGDIATVSATAISGFSAGTISFSAGTAFTSLEIKAGSGSDTVDLSAGPTSIDINAGAGDDLITGSANDDFIDGDVGDDTVDAGDGDDLVLGFSGSDSISGGDGDDELIGDADDDTIDGGLGDDSIEGGDGADSLLGGDGDDTISGGFGNDVIAGQGGNDALLGDFGEDTLLGGGGADALRGGLDDDVIRGGSGRDIITWESADGSDDVGGGNGFDRQVLLGTFGDDSFVVDRQGDTTVVQVGTTVLSIGGGVEQLEIDARGGADEVTLGDITAGDIDRVLVDGGAGVDRLDARNLVGASATLIGSQGADVLYGSDGSDTLLGGAGNDTLIGGTGNDSLRGSSGQDHFVWSVTEGSDTVDGGAADDLLTVNATTGADTLTVGTDGSAPTATILTSALATVTILEVDTLELNLMAGADTVTVEDLTGSSLQNINADLAEGADTFDASGMVASISVRVLGGIGNDRLIAGGGDDFLRGAAGNDTLIGAGGEDEIIGDEGEDSISGGAGQDALDGGGGADTLLGGAGNDTVLGGGGADRIEGNAGSDVIYGAAGQDRIAAGDGDDIVSSGNGADIVSGGEGDDVLIGGRGFDNIEGNGGQDLIVGGRTTLSDSELGRIRSEWLSDRDYDDRADNITGENEDDPADSRANGSVFLLPITSERTVLDDDGAVDTLIGNAGRDLFFADIGTDIIDGRTPSESLIDLR